MGKDMEKEMYVIKIPGKESQHTAKTAEYCAVDLSEQKIPFVRELLRDIAVAQRTYERSVISHKEIHIGTGAGPEMRKRDRLIEKFEDLLKEELDQSSQRHLESDVDAFGQMKRISDAEKFAVSAMIVRWQLLAGLKRSEDQAPA